MQTYQNLAPAVGANNMASFVARLMSLSSHELQCLHSDSELMRHLTETQLLMESRLQNISIQNKISALQHHHQQQQQAVSPNNYYDYYSQAATLSAVANQQYVVANQHHQHHQQQQQQNQQLQLLISHNHQNPLALDLRTQATSQPLVYLQQQQILFANSSPSALSQLQQQQPQPQPHYPSSATSSPNDQHQQQQQSSAKAKPAFNPKKVKLAEQAAANTSGSHQQQDGNSRSSSTSSSISNTSLDTANQLVANKQGEKRSSPNGTPASSKKYKGEFDEPSASEVEERRIMLSRDDNYHTIGTRLGECACVLGSQFRDKSVASVLKIIDQWRHLDTEERIKSKWDVLDLPKDIPLSEIKKFEDLRREASNGRADFGGASKRKPLGIRGTRQFLLILYCLWGHPGREDIMQKEGYCPHCFAKIKKANEQSTLVRVVNHFNMKHRRGANPRLSPNRDTSTSATTAVTSPTSGAKANSTAAHNSPQANQISNDNSTTNSWMANEQDANKKLPLIDTQSTMEASSGLLLLKNERRLINNTSSNIHIQAQADQKAPQSTSPGLRKASESTTGAVKSARTSNSKKHATKDA